MGRSLFIRVSAVTYDEDAVARAWPRLCELAWPEATGGSILPSVGKTPRGVLELVDTLVDQALFADKGEASLSPETAQCLAGLRKELDAALGERDVPTAHRMTHEIEDSLDDAEKNRE